MITPRLMRHYNIWRIDTTTGRRNATGASIEIYSDGTVRYDVNGTSSIPITRAQAAEWLDAARWNETVWLKRRNRY